MKNKFSTKLLAMLIVVIMLGCVFPISAMAAWGYDEDATTDDYYKLISQKNWQLAPGIEETEVVINNAGGTRRQVVHSVIVDMNNPYTNIIPGYKGMIPQVGSYGTQTVSQQALNAEKLGYGNVVAATNATLSWYDNVYYKAHPELVGEPLAYAILDGYYYQNSQGKTAGMSGGSDGILVINYDVHPTTGETRPDNIPKVQMRRLDSPLTGWEQNAIPAWQWLVKPDANGNPVNQYGKDHGSGIASRTFVGVTAEGKVIISVSDGDQAPFSTGFTMYEMADYMIKMGCIYACNQDGGGSTTFCTQRPGEDLKVNCSLSDGGERPVTSTIMVISTAPATGELSSATISSNYDYYTPGSIVEFNTIGIDGSGAKVDIPDDVEWTIAEEGMGTIENGVFTSNGTVGTVTAQMIYKDTVIGEHQINIAIPENITLNQTTVTIPYGKTVKIPVKATVNGGLNEIGLGTDDITFTIDNVALGTFSGLNFIAVDEASAPANISGNVNATLNFGTNPILNFTLKLGKGSEILFDFEGGQSDVDIWNVIDNRKGTIWDYDMSLTLADKTNGQVHDGEYSMRLELNGLSSNLSHSAEYGWIRLGIDGPAIELENARSLGFWMYIPDDCIQLWAQGNYMADTDGNGTYDTQCLISMPPAFPNQVYESVDEPGWYYLEMDLSQYEKIALKDTQQFVKDPSTGASGAKGDFFISFIFARAKNNPILDGKTVIGPYTFYLDNFTVDYSDAVDDREKPEFDKIYMDGTPLVKREVVTTNSSTVSFYSNVVDATVRVDANKVEHPLTIISGINASTAKAFIDGVEIPTSYSNGVISANNITLKDGYHRVRFEITDNAGNTAVMIRVFKVESGNAPASVQFVPADATLDRILFGSIYWMNLEVNAIENIQSVETIIDMNSVNHWQLDHMVLADGFTAEYAIDEDSNTAAITFTRTGESDQTGAMVLAKIPVRILDYDSDIHVAGKTAAQYWATHEFWGHNLALDVDMGLVTFTDGSTETFSNEEFSVDTEMYTARYYMDATYLTTHGSTHIHTPVALSDKSATCTEDGYTGRTFCEECNSVVEWGITIPATGHHYEVVDNKLACHCGKEITGSGIKTIDGKNYYLLAGTLASGWRIDEAVAMADIDTSKYTDVEINLSLVTNTDGWYYFDETTYEGINGKRTFTISGVKIEYNFVNGLVDGVWKSDGTGMKYYYGPANVKYIKRSQLSNFCWVAIDGKIYAFNKDAHRYEGYSVLVNTTGEAILCEFDDDGVLIGKYSPGENYTGIFKCNSQTTYLKNGVPVNAGLVKDGDDYYYIASGYEAVVGNYDVTRPNGLLLPGFYQFASDGKMINPPVYADGPNTDGFFYKGGFKLLSYQLVKFEGYYYYIGDFNKYLRNNQLYLGGEFVEPYGLQAGIYHFDATGKMILNSGPDADGCFYLNGILQKCYQLVEFEGNYYFISDNNKYVTNTNVYLPAKFVEPYGLQAGNYKFDATGKMIVAKNGPDVDGYFYLNGVKQSCYQLVEYEGNYYFINDYNKYAVSKTLFLTDHFTSKYGLPAGNYEFDATGKWIVKNGPDADGYFYLNGVRQSCYQLVEYDGNYYFINDYHEYAVNKSIYLRDQFVSAFGLPAGVYEFDATGKMLVKNGPNEDGYFYLNNVRQSCYQLVEYDGNYYFINDYNKYAVSKTLFLTDHFTSKYGLPAGNYEFDATGKWIVKNGPDADGYFYLNGVRQSCYQLVEYDGNYYFINDYNKYAVNKSIYLRDQFVSAFGLPAGVYEFDATGKMLVKNGPNEDGYFYLNNRIQKSYQLIKWNGDYYYIGDYGKYVTGKWQYTGLPASVFYGTDVRFWHHSFDDKGRMIGYYEGLPNGRDIGDVWNLKTSDGKDVKSGLLIRGIELDNANYYYPEDILAIGIDRLQNEFHVKTEMDLRNPLAVGLDVFGEDVVHKTYNMVLYNEAFTDAGKAKMKEVFTDLANPDNYPIYLHCSHGIDRTGTVCFILEAVLGVPYQSALYEYTLSVESFGQRIVDMNSYINSHYAGASLKEKTENYLKECGITQEQINSLREIYLED